MKWVQHCFTFKETPRERAGNSQRVTWRQGYFALIKTLVRFEKWNEILDGKTIPVYDKPEQQAWRHWAMGLAYSATGQPEKAKADARRDAEAARRGDVGQGADRHRRCRSSKRRSRRAPATARRATSCSARRPTAKRRCSTPSRRPIRVRSSKGWRTSRSRSATTRPPRRRTARRSSASPAAAAPISGWPRRSTGSASRPRRATRAAAPQRRGPTPTRDLPQVQALKTSTAAPQQ